MNKHKLEPYYKNLSLEQAEATGYFEPKHSEINWKQHINIPCTGVNFLKQNVKNPVVIISTGAYCPLHKGHVDNMVLAKEHLEFNNYNVVGGYLSPGHDNYMQEKLNENYLNIEERILWGNDLIKNFNWLQIDPWEGIFAPGSVNFTTVVYRLKKYLQKFYSKNVKIFYVCGADNARFVEPFSHSDIGCIVVNRPNYNDVFSYWKELNTDPNIYFVENNNFESSTDIRKTDRYIHFLKESKKLKQCSIRYNTFDNDKKIIEDLFSKYYSIIWLQNIDDQISNYENTNHYFPTINLDKENNYEDINMSLKISRLYDNFGLKKLGYINSPGTQILQKQFLKIQKQNYKEVDLFDDDIFTGNTMNFVEQELNKLDIKVRSRKSFITSNKYAEIIDLKDFILNKKNGGLVTKIKNKICRVPYIYPFVSPTNRASINDALDFSIKIWQYNFGFYFYNTTTIKDIKSLHYLLDLGHKNTDTISDICKYYIHLLLEIKYYNTNNND